MNLSGKKIIIFGDSIAKGIIFDEAAGKYRPLETCAAALLSARWEQADIKNRSVFGCIAPKGEKLLNRCLENDELPDYVVIEFGGNDCDFDWRKVSAEYLQEHDPHTPRPEFYRSVCRMVQAAREKGVCPVLLNLAPINASRYFDWLTQPEDVVPEQVLHWLVEKEIIYRQQENYSHCLDMIALEYQVPLIDVRSRFLTIRDYDSCLCRDGIHLNEKGQRLLADYIAEWVEERKEQHDDVSSGAWL